MIPYHIAQQFTSKIYYLVAAICEEMDGQVPDQDTLRREITIRTNQDQENPDTTHVTVTRNDTVILLATISMIGDQFRGEFSSVPSIINNEFVQQKLNQWKT